MYRANRYKQGVKMDTFKGKLLLKIEDVVQLLNIGKSTWWKGVKEGRYPAPVKLGPKTTRWKTKDIRRIIDGQNIKY
jgi:predicted DNA-binding transcriptional regulator AlpA